MFRVWQRVCHSFGQLLILFLFHTTTFVLRWNGWLSKNKASSGLPRSRTISGQILAKCSSQGESRFLSVQGLLCGGPFWVHHIYCLNSSLLLFRKQ